MAFKTKQDYYGLGQISGLVLIGTTENKSASTVEAQGEDGFVVATEMFGVRSAPSCEYIITGNVDISNVRFGSITTLSNLGNFVLTNFEINTSAGSAPTVSASGS